MGSTELLTRVGPKSDFATDLCIRREGIDADTGRRYLEELAFEVVSEQPLRDITDKTEDLLARGVRRGSPSSSRPGRSRSGGGPGRR